MGTRGSPVPFMFGELSMPYCWAAKSMTKLVGACEGSKYIPCVFREVPRIEDMGKLPAILLWSTRHPY